MPPAVRREHVPDDPQSQRLEEAARSIFRFGKSVLRITPDGSSVKSLPPAQAQTIPHLPLAQPQGIVCSNLTCHPPTSDPVQLLSLLVAPANPGR